MRRLSRVSSKACRAYATAFAGVEMGPPDPILGLSVAFKDDTNAKKVNLGVGVYRDDDGKPFVLQCVRIAEEQLLAKKLDYEYAPITGVPGFVKAAQKLAFGPDNEALKANRIASSQVLSGTGALRVGADMLNRFAKSTVYLPKPSWANHTNVMRDAGLKQDSYTYFNAESNKLNIDQFVADVKAAPEKSIILMHACAHNPTGQDPTPEEWRRILDAVKSRNHLPFIDMAYQGFASGDVDRDAYALRLFSKECPVLVLAQSFAKSFGMYGQRVGGLHLQCSSAEEAQKVDSQLKIMIRPMYSNPPIHGARIIEQIFNDEKLYAMWKKELVAMADRMNGVRKLLVERLQALGSKRDWTHILRQTGMMAYTGINKDQVARLKTEFHIYMTNDGRAAVTGLTTKNVNYVAEAFHAVTK